MVRAEGLRPTYRVFNLGAEVLVFGPPTRGEMLELSGVRRQQVLHKQRGEHADEEFAVNVDGHGCLGADGPRHLKLGRWRLALSSAPTWSVRRQWHLAEMRNVVTV